MDIFSEVQAFRDLGIYFKLVSLHGSQEFRLELEPTPRAFSSVTDASQFRDSFEHEIRLVLMAGDDTKMLLGLDFLRWRVDQEHFGPLPGLRVIRPRRAERDDDVLPDKD